MKRVIMLCMLAAGVAAGGEWEGPEARERAAMEEMEARNRARMEAFRRALQKEISVNFEEESLGEAVSFVAEAAGVSVAIHKDVERDEEVSLKLDSFAAHAVLEILARISDLRLELQGGVVVLMPKDDEKNEIGTLYLELGPFDIELAVYEDDIPPDLRHDLVRRALRAMQGRRERERELDNPEREEEIEGLHRREHDRREPLERPGRNEEF